MRDEKNWRRKKETWMRLRTDQDDEEKKQSSKSERTRGRKERDGMERDVHVLGGNGKE